MNNYYCYLRTLIDPYSLYGTAKNENSTILISYSTNAWAALVWHSCWRRWRTFRISKEESSEVNESEHGRGPSTTPSNQFVVKCIVRGHHVYKHIQFESLRLRHLRQVCRGCTSEQLFNCSWTHPEGNNMLLPLSVK